MTRCFSRQDEKFMRLALDKALRGVRGGQTPFGACLVRRGKVICVEHNKVWASTDITAHAEIRAIRSACRKLKSVSLKDCVIYSTCEPCPMCFSACHWAGIALIYFGAAIADAKEAGFNELPIRSTDMKSLGQSRIKVIGGLLRGENMELLESWADHHRGRTY